MEPSEPAIEGRKYSWRQRLRYRGGETMLRAPFVWWRHRGLRPADVFIATYPRSGYTWLRFLLFDILTGRSAQFREVDASIPYISRQAGARPMLPGEGRLLATHETYRREYSRAIYMVRDVRDVAVSEFLREQAKGLVTDVDDYLAKFLAGKKRHGSWADHVSSWLDSGIGNSGNLLLLRYEDLHREPEDTLRRTVDFLSVKVRPDSIPRAIADNTIERMRAKEDAANTTIRGKGEDGRFVRNGGIGQWMTHLTERQVRCMEICTEAVLQRMGYPFLSSLEESKANNEAAAAPAEKNAAQVATGA